MIARWGIEFEFVARTQNNEDRLLRLFSFCFELWINLLGGTLPIVQKFFKFKRIWLELLQDAEVETPVEINLRI
jgi:hypothetical protein